MKRALIPVLIILAFSLTAALEINIETVDGEVFPGNNFQYDVHFENDEHYTLNLDAVTYDGTLSPRPSYTLTPGEEQTVRFEVPVPLDAYPMRNLYPLMIRDNLEREWRFEVEGFIKFRPNEIKIEELSFPTDHDPREPLLVKTKINNMKTAKNVEFELRVYDDYGNIITKNTTDLELNADEESTIPMYVKMPSSTTPGEYRLEAIILLYSIPSQPYYINVIPVEDYELVRETEDKFLGKEGKVIIQNTGNTEIVNQDVSTPVSALDRFFVISKSDNTKYMSGNMVMTENIPAGQEKVLFYKISYIPILLIPIILALIGAYFYFLTIKVVIKKEILKYRKTDEEINIKVALRIKNTFNRTIRDIEVFDPIPAFVKEISSFGTIKGKTQQRGHIKYIKWVIEELKPREEVVVSYTTSTKLGILGRFKLHSALAEFVHMKKMYKTKSNNVEITIE